MKKTFALVVLLVLIYYVYQKYGKSRLTAAILPADPNVAAMYAAESDRLQKMGALAIAEKETIGRLENQRLIAEGQKNLLDAQSESETDYLVQFMRAQPLSKVETVEVHILSG